MKKWNEKTTVEKIAYVISGIALGVWLIFEALGRSGKIQFAELGGCIALCIVCLCEAISFWNVKRGLSYVAIAGIVCMVSAIVLQALLIG